MTLPANLRARINAYPAPFRERLKKHLKNAPDTAPSFVLHELVACDAALILINAHPSLELYRAWCQSHEYPLPEKVKSMTLGVGQLKLASSMVHWWWTNKDNIVREHALMAEAVGCAVAGCHVAPSCASALPLPSPDKEEDAS